MAALTPGSELLNQYFGAENLGDVSFEAEGPTYAQLQNSFLYPDNENIVNRPEQMNGGQSRDMREGLRLFMWELAVTYASDEGDPNISINIPTMLLQTGLSRIVNSEGVRENLTDSQVASLFNAAQELQQGKPGQAILTVLGVAMGAIGMAVPVVGWIGALVLGLTKGITAIVQRRNAADMADAAARTAALYRSFPPLQTQDSAMDGEVVQAGIRQRLKFHDWTDIWAPRFRGEWTGVNRDGGFAFAQGGTVEGGQLGQAARLFEATGGVGVIPGTSEVTAVIQVSLETNPDLYPENAAWQAFINGGPDPRGIDINGVKGYTRVTDTGIYYPATGRLAASLWEMLSNTADYGDHGNPYLYRVDCRRLHPAWQEWAEAGLRYIREVCYPWYAEHVTPEGKINAPLDINGPYPGRNQAGFFGTAIYSSIGAWAATVVGGSSTKPKYSVYSRPYGILGSQLSAYPRAYGNPKSKVSSLFSGGFLPILDQDDWFDGGMGERYHRGPGNIGTTTPTSIELTLNNLQSLQAWSLRHTLVSAYCSERDAAFTGPANASSLETLRQLRKVMLESEDRFYIDINDVPRNEPALPGYPGMNGLAKDWRDQLIKSGVPPVPKDSKPGKGGLKLSAGINLPDPGPANPCEAGVWCPGEPAPGPMTFVPGNADPWEPQIPKRRGVVRGGGGGIGGGAILAGVGVTALLGTGLVMAARARMKPRRSFSGRVR